MKVYAVQLIIGNAGYLILLALTGALGTALALWDGVAVKSRMFMAWMLFLVWMCICSVVGGQGALYALYYVGSIAIWLLINEWYLSRGSLALLKASKIYVGAAIVLTLLQQLFFTDIFGTVESGSGNLRNFLASDNFLGYYYTAYIAVCLILDHIECKKVRVSSYVMMAVCLISMVKAWSVKSMLGIAVIILYVIFAYGKRWSKKLNVTTLTVVYVVIFVLVVFMDIQSYSYGFIETMFQKQNTVASRSQIWAEAIKNIAKSPVFGYGVPDGGRLHINDIGRSYPLSSHNIFLEVILEGGFIGGGIFALSYIGGLVHGDKTCGKDDRYEFLMLLFINFIFLVMQMASGSVYFPFYYMPLVLIDNMGRIRKTGERKSKGIIGKETGVHSN